MSIIICLKSLISISLIPLSLSLNCSKHLISIPAVCNDRIRELIFLNLSGSVSAIFLISLAIKVKCIMLTECDDELILIWYVIIPAWLLLLSIVPLVLGILIIYFAWCHVLLLFDLRTIVISSWWQIHTLRLRVWLYYFLIRKLFNLWYRCLNQFLLINWCWPYWSLCSMSIGLT